ncbi:MAG: peptide chain release factor N(5)-glutamine methyltransferase [Candidatus Omnitrophica bacterium]|nr:peptide chain release factor N(5)-glutamine methyltransferase [Candidatus Omnitrophota bacterium]
MLGEVETQLRGAGVGSARAEAEWLVADTLGVSRTDLYLWDGPISSAQAAELEERMARRLSGEPLQYVLGSVEFLGHRLAVNPSVLIPRPETEALAAQAIVTLQALASAGRPREIAASPISRGREPVLVLDVGTGSGCLAISLAHAVGACAITALELSWKTLQTARTNVLAHHLDDRIHLIQSDWTSGVGGLFSLIVSNPPYVPSGELAGLPDNVRREPRESLDGGSDGMRFHRRLLMDAERLLAPGGSLMMECAESQAEALRASAEGLSWAAEASVGNDLAGRPRIVSVRRRDSLTPHRTHSTSTGVRDVAPRRGA